MWGGWVVCGSVWGGLGGRGVQGVRGAGYRLWGAGWGMGVGVRVLCGGGCGGRRCGCLRPMNIARFFLKQQVMSDLSARNSGFDEHDCFPDLLVDFGLTVHFSCLLSVWFWKSGFHFLRLFSMKM